LQLARYAAAEVHPPAERGRAISNVVIGGTVGAIIGPLMVGPTGQWAVQLGLGELAGPYAISLALFALGAVLVFTMLKPDPRDIGKAIATLHPETVAHHGAARRISEIMRVPAAIAAMTAMVFGQLVMVMVMVITSLYMVQHQHRLDSVALVVSSHTIGMYAFSIFSGRLADRWGRAPVILVGASTLVLACLSATLSPDVLPLAFALFLLGLGWNFCYVGGSSLLADQLSPEERARTQGFNDLLIGLVSAAGGLFSGIIFANIGYIAMGYVGALAALVPLAMIAWWKLGTQKLMEA
jgi:MFS family permease